MKKIILLLLICFSFHIYASENQDINSNVKTTRSLLLWMEKNLNQQSHFSVSDLKKYFGNHFIIYSNNKIIHATPSTYCGFLYQYKKNMISVHYDIQDMIAGNATVTVPFIIHIQSNQKRNNQNLRVIAIFSFNQNGKIAQWREVFTKNS